jgi:hypothetical protein
LELIQPVRFGLRSMSAKFASRLGREFVARGLRATG